MYSLSNRELEVLYYMTKGLNNNEIADVLCISKHTAKSHVSSIITKMDISTRSEATFLAGKYSLV